MKVPVQCGCRSAQDNARQRLACRTWEQPAIVIQPAVLHISQLNDSVSTYLNALRAKAKSKATKPADKVALFKLAEQFVQQVSLIAGSTYSYGTRYCCSAARCNNSI